MQKSVILVTSVKVKPNNAQSCTKPLYTKHYFGVTFWGGLIYWSEPAKFKITTNNPIAVTSDTSEPSGFCKVQSCTVLLQIHKFLFVIQVFWLLSIQRSRVLLHPQPSWSTSLQWVNSYFKSSQSYSLPAILQTFCIVLICNCLANILFFLIFPTQFPCTLWGRFRKST